MGSCELCGADAQNTRTVKIAGSFMQVCNSCGELGKEQLEVKKAHTFTRKSRDDRPVVFLKENYNSLIQSAISKRGLNLQQLSRAVNIKESSLNKYMASKLKPDIATAQKIEHFLEISLTEEGASSSASQETFISKDDENLSTLGDLLQKALKK